MVEMTAFVVIAIWGLVVIGCLVAVSVNERKQWQAERKDLLNRIMTRDYREFSACEPKANDLTPMKVVPLDELRRELQGDEGQPLGMPV
jgi:hypothetical protein